MELREAYEVLRIMESDFEYLKGLLSSLADDEHAYCCETIITFYGALLGEYVV